MNLKSSLDIVVIVLATIEHIDDKELFKEMDRENRLRAVAKGCSGGIRFHIGYSLSEVSTLK
jgi:hypothetical protein